MNRSVIPLLLLFTAALISMGCIMITSTGIWSAAQNQDEFQQTQLQCVNIGILLSLFAFFFKSDWTRKLAPILFVIGCILLILCYDIISPFAVTVNKSSRWVKFPGLPQFQASEIAKITTLIGVAAWYAHYSAQEKSLLKGFVIPGSILSIPIFLIFFEQDMDTAAALAIVCGVAMVLNGVRLRFILPVAAVALACGIFLVQQSEIRMQRIRAFQQLENYPNSPREIQDFNRQQWHSLLAFGNGGYEGVGLGEGQEKHGYMPEAHTDFVLAVMGEELGLKMTLCVILCYAMIGFCGFYIASQARRKFSCLLAASLTLMILLPAMINIAVVTAKIPVAGLPLPFVSYGGTNLIFSMISIAIIMSIHRESLQLASDTYPEAHQQFRPSRL